MRTQWPCLSFDIIRDRLGTGRKKFPLTTYLVAGTQADRPDRNEVLVMKMGDLHKTQNRSREEDDDGFNMESDDDDDDVDGDPYLLTQSVPHNGGVNRIRSMPQAPHVVATWSETSDVHVWNLEHKLAALDGPAGVTAASKGTGADAPAFTYTGHSDEGYAMAWSPVKAGRMVTGDCRNGIFLWDAAGSSGAASFAVDAVPFVGHQGSVEDLQWSHTEENVFASCSADRSVRIFDTRRHASSMLAIEGAHSEDVNVISWNPLVGFLLASGSDDGSFKIWDLRKFEKESPVAHFKFHRAPITSIEWSNDEDSVIATSSADHTCIVWDMSLEEDKEELEAGRPTIEGGEDIPPQMLFCHQGQRDIKELHFHPQIPGLIVSTAADGFNLWRPCNL
jgi:ribosome assembly protein RRB1